MEDRLDYMNNCPFVIGRYMFEFLFGLANYHQRNRHRQYSYPFALFHLYGVGRSLIAVVLIVYFLQLFLQVATTATFFLWLFAVLAEVLCYVVFVDAKQTNYCPMGHALYKQCNAQQYGYNLLQRCKGSRREL